MVLFLTTTKRCEIGWLLFTVEYLKQEPLGSWELTRPRCSCHNSNWPRQLEMCNNSATGAQNIFSIVICQKLLCAGACRSLFTPPLQLLPLQKQPWRSTGPTTESPGSQFEN